MQVDRGKLSSPAVAPDRCSAPGPSGARGLLVRGRCFSTWDLARPSSEASPVSGMQCCTSLLATGGARLGVTGRGVDPDAEREG